MYIARDLDKYGLCEPLIMFQCMLASITQVSNTAAGFGKNGDDDDSINIMPATVTPSKKSCF